MTAAPDRIDRITRIMVAFQGPGSGEDALSWGQKENWSAIVAQDTWLPLGGVKPLTPDTTVDEIAAELAYLMGRYQVLRTRLRFTEQDREQEREQVRQVVHATGEIALEIADTGGADPEDTAAALHARYRATPLDFAAEWPIRMGLVRHRDRLTHMVVLISHLATDAVGATVLMTEVATRESAPVTGMEPLAQARWQASPAGRRQNEAAMRHWENSLRSISPRRFPPSNGIERPRYWEAEFESAAMLPAVHALAARHGMESTTVLLALFGHALHAVTGTSPVVVRPIVGNRFRPGLASVVCTLAQGGICVLDIGGRPFVEALERTRRAALAAYKYAYFDHDDMVEVRTRVAAERGVAIDTGVYFNDRRSSTLDTGSHEDTGSDEDTGTDADIAAVTADTAGEAKLRWVLGQDAPSFEPLFLHVEDSTEAVRFRLAIDTHAISRDDVERLLLTMERTAVEAWYPALTPAAPCSGPRDSGASRP